MAVMHATLNVKSPSTAAYILVSRPAIHHMHPKPVPSRPVLSKPARAVRTQSRPRPPTRFQPPHQPPSLRDPLVLLPSLHVNLPAASLCQVVIMLVLHYATSALARLVASQSSDPAVVVVLRAAFHVSQSAIRTKYSVRSRVRRYARVGDISAIACVARWRRWLLRQRRGRRVPEHSLRRKWVSGKNAEDCMNVI
ncbi:hypothetical protein H0H92_000108 [Tricholoma furcatifolium]|nr:hypothetical protein H0H92_000108 [Tricholoma furcatifolium]